MAAMNGHKVSGAKNDKFKCGNESQKEKEKKKKS